MELKAVIFDLDGVITETADLHYVAWKSMAEQIGITITEQENEQLKGLSRKASLEKILELGNVSLPEQEKKQLTESKNLHYQELLTDLNEDHTLIGFRPFLRDCKDNNIKVAVGSASRNAKKILQQLNLYHTFDAIVDGTMVTHSKPNPEVFLTAAELMDVSPLETVVFEDAVSGIEAANRGGFFSIGVGDEKVLTEADYVIANMEHFTVDKLIDIINS